MSPRGGTKCFVFYCLVHLSHLSLACILLLNGWSPLTVYERSSLADIVAVGEVLHAFKNVRTNAGTYTAEVRVLTVHKGAQLIQDVLSKAGGLATASVFNISNFGDKAMCYADVRHGEMYIFFLTVFRNRLSAKYDDVFGAAAEFSEENERQVLDYLGWHSWSKWSSCSDTCGTGHQSRRRKCSRENVTLCEGSQLDSRHCNTFSCSETFDLLTLFGIPKLPFGVTRSQNRTNGYVITPTAKLFLPVSSLFHAHFPTNFSLLMTTLRSAEHEGFVFVVSDTTGRQRIGLYMGSNIRLDYVDDPAKGIISLTFEVSVTAGVWHHIAISVQGRKVILYFDCISMIEKKIKRGANSMGTNLMFSIGPYFANFGPAFEGEIEQLFFSDNPGIAERQCYFQTGDHIALMKDDNSNKEQDPVVSPSTPSKEVIKPTSQTIVYWSSWSSCSATCGQGRQLRSLSCAKIPGDSSPDNSSHVASANPRSTILVTCVPNDIPREQVRSCWVQDCAVNCPEPCQNGGTCLTNGRCQCLPGFYGEFCQTAQCNPGCQNGGDCASPGKCNCSKTFTGNYCETPVCEPPCKNGGRCTENNRCACPYGYTGKDCQPICKQECSNGGRCVGYDKCRCRKGYTGHYCTELVCRHGCANGGKCVSPNRCSCPSNYRGARCNISVCRPSCKNGGKCVSPNLCVCPPSRFGQRCQKYICEDKCLNGGHCVGPNRCQCKPGYSGKHCQKETCNITCLNGGTCKRHKKRCRCPKGFFGRRCERRTCAYEQYTIPYKKSYRRIVREEEVTSCGPWSWKTCIRTKVKYIIVSKDSVRTAYRCV